MTLLVLGLICYAFCGFFMLRLAYVLFSEALYGSVENSQVPFYYMIIGVGLYFLKYPVVWMAIFVFFYMLFQ